MNFEYIESYLAVCRYKSISEAAKSLYISQPTLTNRLKKLEEYLDVTLFERSWKGIQLTVKGEEFLPYALKMATLLNELQALSTCVNTAIPLTPNYKKDPIRFNIGINCHLIDFAEVIIHSLFEKFPHILIDITFGSTQELITKCHYEMLDYIVYYCLDSIIPNTTKLMDENLVVILSEMDYEFIKQDIKLLKSLKKPVFVNEDPRQVQFSSLFQAVGEKLQISDVVFIANNHLITTLVQSNKGYTIMPESVYHFYCHHQQLKAIRLDNPNFIVPIYSSYNNKSDLAPFIAPLLDEVIISQMNTYKPAN